MIESRKEDNILTIILPARIDASNAGEAEAEIDAIREGNQSDRIIFDASKLTYISSAGLRIIIKVVKKEQSVSVINVSPAVYSIFEVSGFTNFIPIEKAA